MIFCNFYRSEARCRGGWSTEWGVVQRVLNDCITRRINEMTYEDVTDAINNKLRAPPCNMPCNSLTHSIYTVTLEVDDSDPLASDQFCVDFRSDSIQKLLVSWVASLKTKRVKEPFQLFSSIPSTAPAGSMLFEKLAHNAQ